MSEQQPTRTYGCQILSCQHQEVVATPQPVQPGAVTWPTMYCEDHPHLEMRLVKVEGSKKS